MGARQQTSPLASSAVSTSPQRVRRLPSLHDAALPLHLVGSFLFCRALAVDAQAHVPLLLQGQQILKQFLYIGVRLGRRLHEGTLPGGGLSLGLLPLHLALGRLVAFVAHKHDGNGLHCPFDGQDLLVNGFQLFQ